MNVYLKLVFKYIFVLFIIVSFFGAARAICTWTGLHACNDKHTGLQVCMNSDHGTIKKYGNALNTIPRMSELSISDIADPMAVNFNFQQVLWNKLRAPQEPGGPLAVQ